MRTSLSVETQIINILIPSTQAPKVKFLFEQNQMLAKQLEEYENQQSFKFEATT